MAEHLGPEFWIKTRLAVLPELGHTFKENVDHEHTSAYRLLGGGPSSARMTGDRARLTPTALNEGWDVPVRTYCDH